MSLLSVDDLVVEHRYPRPPVVRAVAGASLEVAPGEVVGLVGESGCGKSTLARAVCGLTRHRGPDHVRRATGDAARAAARKLTGIQMVFQDPYASLNPRRRVGDQIADGLRTAATPPPPAAPTCWNASGCRATSPAGTRTSSPAASGSASRSPGRWRPGRGC